MAHIGSLEAIKEVGLGSIMLNNKEDFRNAIASVALVRKAEGALIIVKEQSGEQAPWLFDFRALMLQPKWLNIYAELFWERYEAQLPFQVAGMETAGISLVAAIVMKGVERGTPVNGFFLRKSRKRQGLMKQIEGTLTDEPVILVDDLLNTGNTIEKALAVLSDAGKQVSDLCTILAFRDETAYKHLEKYGVRVDSFFRLPDFDIPLLEKRARTDTELELLWRFPAPNPSLHLVVHKSSPALDDSHVYFGSDDGTFYALDRKTGAIVWKFAVGTHPQGKGILSSPAVHNGLVYFGAYDGAVYALNAKNGSVVWKYEEADWVGSSPALAVSENLLFIGLEFGLWKKRGGVAALDMKTGKEVWRASMPSLTHASPLYIKEESLVVIGSNDGYLRAYNARTGEAYWESRSEGDIKMSPAYDPDRKLVCFGSMDSKLYAVRARDGIPIFAYQTGGNIYSSPLVHDGIVYVTSLDKKLYAIDLDSGASVWTYTTNGRIFASPAFSAGSIWIGSNDGKLYEINSKSGMLLSTFQASERIVTRPTFSDEKTIYFASVANELYCIKRKQR